MLETASQFRLEFFLADVGSACASELVGRLEGFERFLGEKHVRILAGENERSTSTAARGSSDESGTSLVRVDVVSLALGESIVELLNVDGQLKLLCCS